MAARNHQDAFTCGKRDDKFEEGRSLKSVAQQFGIDISVVLRACKTYKMIVTAVRKVGGGRPGNTTASDDWYIVLQEKRGLN
ncbi:hypothetical protein TNCV_2861701 [Trichonephila clavipes]|nr:hypothetical protein TNCV_2861701 [Trichonephila clavipes]